MAKISALASKCIPTGPVLASIKLLHGTQLQLTDEPSNYNLSDLSLTTFTIHID